MDMPQSLNCKIRQGAPSKDWTSALVEVPGTTLASLEALMVSTLGGGGITFAQPSSLRAAEAPRKHIARPAL
jgi:hypothetical protein